MKHPLQTLSNLSAPYSFVASPFNVSDINSFTSPSTIVQSGLGGLSGYKVHTVIQRNIVVLKPSHAVGCGFTDA